MKHTSKSKEKRYIYIVQLIPKEARLIFYLSCKRDEKAAKCFLKKVLASCHATKPRLITTDEDKTHPVAIRERKEEKCIPLRVKKYLNNIIEQDHRSIKKTIRNMLGLKSLQTAIKMWSYPR
nr:DDE-type integrase/transposase/recombinase [Bacillus cereus]